MYLYIHFRNYISTFAFNLVLELSIGRLGFCIFSGQPSLLQPFFPLIATLHRLSTAAVDRRSPPLTVDRRRWPSIAAVDHQPWKYILVLTMHDQLLIGDPPHAIACSWVEIWWHGRPRNKMQLEDQVQR